MFGLRQPLVERWVDAFQTLGPVERIEPAPVALARALARGAVRAGVLLRALGAAHGVELTDLRGGRVHQVRRLFGDLASAARELADANGDPSHVHLEPWDDADVRPLREALPAGRDRAPAIRRRRAGGIPRGVRGDAGPP